MLEGKPQKIDETETMRAITSILNDSAQVSHPQKMPRETYGEPAAVLTRLTMTPVRDDVARVAAPPSTAVPTGARPKAFAESIYANPQVKVANDCVDQAVLQAAATASQTVPWVPRISALVVLFTSALLYPDLINLL